MGQVKENRTKNSFKKNIEEKEKRKLKALRSKNNVWFGLGVMGMIGWSIVLPALLGAFTGLWLDKQYPQTFSWTLSLLIAGIISGSVIAWYWIAKEDEEMHIDNDD